MYVPIISSQSSGADMAELRECRSKSGDSDRRRPQQRAAQRLQRRANGKVTYFIPWADAKSWNETHSFWEPGKRQWIPHAPKGHEGVLGSQQRNSRRAWRYRDRKACTFLFRLYPPSAHCLPTRRLRHSPTSINRGNGRERP